MPELGSLDNKQAASHVGLAPVARQSGQWKGKSFIRGGRANVRQVLYMPALVAARFNPDLKAKPAAHRCRKTRQNRHHCRHAKTHRHRKCSAQSRPPLDQISRLTTTDTLTVSSALASRHGSTASVI
ncbi:transposase [Novosphingobium sp. P6W]|uniref:transposase n=1 Tax=Novosphingobium sp. P6W TaxID=1609758 RepID=UPI003513DFF7